MSTEVTPTTALPPVVDEKTWSAALAQLRAREKAATRELDAVAAQRRRLPMVRMPEYTLIGADGPVSLADIFRGRSQLITYHHMWTDGAEWQCGGCTGCTSQFTRLGFLDNYDARFVIVTNGPIEEALAYRHKVGNQMEWYSTAQSSFGADVDAGPGEGFGVNVFLRDGDTVYRTWHTTGRGIEQLTHFFGLIDILPWGRQEEWQDSPEGWPQRPTYEGWLDSPDIARAYGPEHFRVTRVIPAPPEAVFAVLADPSRHHETEPSDWVRDAIDTAPLTHAGQLFAMNMFFNKAGGHYVTHNLVDVFEQDHVIGWRTGQLDESGEFAPGGWSWRYDLWPLSSGTEVTLTYDWTSTPQSFREQIHMPPFGADYLAASLATLERSVTR
jgi:predicted dithiol-disulfide oxidoreductase (DUF899 family)/uncharacterized protein YndB with AHSA1/START domain